VGAAAGVGWQLLHEGLLLHEGQLLHAGLVQAGVEVHESQGASQQVVFFLLILFRSHTSKPHLHFLSVAPQHVGASQPHDGASQPHDGASQPHDGASQLQAGLSQPHEGASQAGASQPHDGASQPHDGASQPHDGAEPQAGFFFLNTLSAEWKLICIPGKRFCGPH